MPALPNGPSSALRNGSSSAIDTIYLISHTHTDIGYTDHQDTVDRQHLEFIDRAIELCEETAGYPPEAQYRWTCEVSSYVEMYLCSRSPAQVDRFLQLHRQGRMAVGAMSYHWTPMLSPAAMIHSLFPTMRLRREYGLSIRTAMQCDVNGASWLWADLLPAIGVDGFTMSINMHRGLRPGRFRRPPPGYPFPSSRTASGGTVAGTQRATGGELGGPSEGSRRTLCSHALGIGPLLSGGNANRCLVMHGSRG